MYIYVLCSCVDLHLLRVRNVVERLRAGDVMAVIELDMTRQGSTVGSCSIWLDMCNTIHRNSGRYPRVIM